MCSKFKVILLIGCFLLVATTALAEPFWYFHTGHTIKYARVKSDGTSWIVTMTIGAGGQSVCGQTDYYKLDEYNYDNKGETSTKYLRVTDTQGFQCQDPTGTPTEIMFFQTGPEGTGWSYGTDTDGVKFQVVGQTKWGTQYIIRRVQIQGGTPQPAVFNHFQKGFGLWKETDNWVSGDAPWTQTRYGYRGKTLYATSADGSLWVYDYDGNASWAKVDKGTPTKMVAAGPLLYATYASGLYVWDGATWTRIDKVVPDSMVAIGSTLYAAWAGSGLWKWNGATWTRIDKVVPDSMVASGSALYTAYAAYGLWKWDGATWTQIDRNVPTKIVSGRSSE